MLTAEKRPCPVRNGIVVPVLEVMDGFTALRPNKANNHHDERTARLFSRCALWSAIRFGEAHQARLPIEIHDLYHELYDDPKPPTPEQGLKEFERMVECGEYFKIAIHEKYKSPLYWKIEHEPIVKTERGYIYKAISDRAIKLVQQDYMRLKRDN